MFISIKKNAHELCIIIVIIDNICVVYRRLYTYAQKSATNYEYTLEYIET